MTTKTDANGQARKTLSSQLDRLDSILDGLSEGLNEAVATAVEGAVQLAVRQAVKETLQALISEALTNADLLAAARTLLAPGAQAGVPADPPGRPNGLLRRACEGVKAGLTAVGAACGGAGAYARRQAAAVKSAARAGWLLAKRFRCRVLAACGVGVATGVVTYLAGPWLGIAVSSAAGFVTTLAVQAGSGLRKLLCSPAVA
jgi:hypothetical protein